MNTITPLDDQPIKMSPENLEVAQTYLQLTDINQTAKTLNISVEDVTIILAKREVKVFIDTVYLDQGYLNKHRLQDIMGTMIAAKLEECEETEIYSSKDLLDIMALAHKMRKEEIELMIKLEVAKSGGTSGNTTNIQNNFNSNYDDLLTRIMTGGKP